jgi:signal recognition particle receptor subunit beta
VHSRTSELGYSFSPPAPVAALAPLRDTARDGLKVAVVGGFGVGKSTLVGAVSEIRPLRTEETMTRAGAAVDDRSGVPHKTRTTVAFDFGRITLDDEMVLYLFGAPGQERFWFLWERLFSGTLGAVVLVDTRRIADSWYAIDRLEHLGLPFVVARNNFGPPQHSLAELRDALDLPAQVPLIDCDARKRHSAKRVLLTLVDHLLTLSAEGPPLSDGPGPRAPGWVGGFGPGGRPGEHGEFGEFGEGPR